jgi:hypothetical protein
MAIRVSSIENLQILWVSVNSNRSDDERLYIFTGVAVLDTWHRTDDDDWGRDTASISLGPFGLSPSSGAPLIRYDQWVDATAMAAPAAFQFRETHARALVGVAVNSVRHFAPTRDADTPVYGINVDLHLRGNDAWFHRISFQLNVLTQGVG